MLRVEGLESGYGPIQILWGVSLHLDAGEVVTLLGANGAGKTTLMDLISGKTKSTSGRVFLHDTDITNWEEHKIAQGTPATIKSNPDVIKAYLGAAS